MTTSDDQREADDFRLTLLAHVYDAQRMLEAGQPPAPTTVRGLLDGINRFSVLSSRPVLPVTRDELAHAYDPQAFTEKAMDSTRRDPFVIQWAARRKLALEAADRVLASRPALPARDEDDCPECGGSERETVATKYTRSSAPDGRLRMNEVSVYVDEVCATCSNSFRQTDLDAFLAARPSSPQAADEGCCFLCRGDSSTTHEACRCHDDERGKLIAEAKAATGRRDPDWAYIERLVGRLVAALESDGQQR